MAWSRPRIRRLSLDGAPFRLISAVGIVAEAGFEKMGRVLAGDGNGLEFLLFWRGVRVDLVFVIGADGG